MSLIDNEKQQVRGIGERIGYGRMMQLAEELWSEDLKQDGLKFGVSCNGGGALSVGPCRAFLVPCPCTDRVACDWCCGSGRVTKRVAAAVEAEQQR